MSELLNNASWQDMNLGGVPIGWEVRCLRREAVTVKDGVMTLDGQASSSEVYLIQRNLPLNTDVQYQLQYAIRGSGSYRCYVEWNCGVRTRAVGARWTAASDAWQHGLLDVCLPAGARLPKLVFHVGAKARVQIQSLSLKRLSGELLKNASFRRVSDSGVPVSWNVRGGAGAVEVRDGVAVLRRTTAASPFLIQVPLALKPGKHYQVSADIMGDTGTTYRFYAEEVAGTRRRAFGISSPSPAPQAWRRVSFEMCPQREDSRLQLVLNNPGNGAIRFRALEIKCMHEVKVRTDLKSNLSMLGVPVTFNGGSNHGERMDGMNCAVIEYVSNYVAGATLHDVPVVPGRRYELDYEVKGLGLSTKGGTGILHFFDVRIDLKDGSELIRSSWDDVMNHGFIKKRFLFQVPRKHGGKIDISLGVAEGSRVAFRLKDLKECPENPLDKMRLVLLSPCYRDGIYETLPVSEVSGYVESPSGSVDLTVDREGSCLARIRHRISAEHRAMFSFPATLFKLGKSTLTCRFLDPHGVCVKVLKRVITRYPRASGNEVVIGQNRHFYVNGNVFFPIMHYGMRPDGLMHTFQEDIDTIRYVSRGGGNVFIMSPKDEREALRLLDLLAENQAKMMLSTGFWGGPVTQGNLHNWEQGVRRILTPKVLAHRALFGIYFADEPRWNGVPVINLQASADVLRKVAPYHPLCIIAAPRGSVADNRPYAEIADFFGIDIYPVPEGAHSNLNNRTLSCVGEYSRRAESMVWGRKPIMMVLQGFAWGNLSGAKAVYPTFKQTRFMVYDALLNGATHISYYSFRHVRSPRFIDVINRMTRELHIMSGVLTAGRLVSEEKTGDICVRILEHGGSFYAIALNESGKVPDKDFSIDLPCKEVSVLGESRIIPVTNGSFRDRLAGYGVRIYCSAPLPEPVWKLPGGMVDNPWKRYVRLRAVVKGYSGHASWIWDRDLINTAMCRVYLARKFKLNKPVKRVILLASADNHAEVWLNDKKIGHVDDWKMMTQLDLTSAIQRGPNLLSVTAADSLQPPCAFLAEIKIEYKDGSQETIVTDGTWRCLSKSVPGWRTQAVVDSLFKAVDYIVPYGEGRWGRRVNLTAENQEVMP